MKILLVSTVDMQGGRGDYLERLLQSVAATSLAREGRVRHLLLCQRAGDAEAAAIAARYAFVHARAIPELIPLSRARNMLLFSDPSALNDADVVAYPDDDAWYPPDFLERAVAVLGAENASFFFCRYSASPERWQSEPRFDVHRAGGRSVVLHATSNTLFLRRDLVEATGPFDEDLGAGTAMINAEDTDYALRAFLRSRRTVWVDAKLVGHRAPTQDIRKRYFAGDLFVLARYATRDFTVFAMFLRKLAIGAHYAITGQMPAKEIARIFRLVGRGLARKSPLSVQAPAKRVA